MQFSHTAETAESAEKKIILRLLGGLCGKEPRPLTFLETGKALFLASPCGIRSKIDMENSIWHA
jgi:hypothetical protein